MSSNALAPQDELTPIRSGSVSLGPVTVTPRIMSLHASQLSQLIEEKKELAGLIQNYLEKDIDFGTIPGTRKPTLYKAGAEKVTQAYQCYPHYEIITAEVDHDREVKWTKSYGKGNNKRAVSGVSIGLYRYVVRCLLIHRPSGATVAEGLGACSTMESKYVDRPREAENTALKIAKKRAHVDAALTGFGLSERFTQDVEDTKLSGDGAAEDPKEAEEPALTIEAARSIVVNGKKLGELTPAQLASVSGWAAQKLEKDPNSAKFSNLWTACELLMEAAGTDGPALDPQPASSTSDTASAAASSAPTTSTPPSTPRAPSTDSASNTPTASPTSTTETTSQPESPRETTSPPAPTGSTASSTATTSSAEPTVAQLQRAAEDAAALAPSENNVGALQQKLTAIINDERMQEDMKRKFRNESLRYVGNSQENITALKRIIERALRSLEIPF